MEFIDFLKKVMSGTPFLEHGRGYDGLDCWGLVYLGYKEVLGIELPTYTKDYESIHNRDQLRDLISEKKQQNWIEVKEPNQMDVPLIFMRGRPMHVGLMINKFRMLHIEEGIQACNEPVTRFRIEGFYRLCQN